MRRKELTRISVGMFCALALLVSSTATPAKAGLTDLPITGTVTDQAGSPLEDVLISSGNKWTWTDASGNFSIDQPMGANFTLSASKMGLVDAYKSGTALPGASVDFKLFYTLSVAISPDAFNNSSPTTITITAKSYAPSNSCVTWTDDSAGVSVLLDRDPSQVGPQFTWTGTYTVPTSTADATYGTTTRVKPCSDNILLTNDVKRSYLVDSIAPTLLATSPLDKGNASVSSLHLEALFGDAGGSGIAASTVSFELTDLGTPETPSEIGQRVSIKEFDSSIQLARSERVNVTDRHRYRLDLSAADRAGNTVTASHTFLANTWVALDVPKVTLSHGEPIPGDVIQASDGSFKRKWSFPTLTATAEPYNIRVSGMMHPAWGTIPIVADFRAVKVNYLVAGQDLGSSVNATMAGSTTFPQGMVFAQHAAQMSPGRTATSTVTVQRGEVEMGSMQLELPLEAEAPTFRTEVIGYETKVDQVPFKIYTTMADHCFYGPDGPICGPNLPGLTLVDRLEARLSDAEARALAASQAFVDEHTKQICQQDPACVAELQARTLTYHLPVFLDDVETLSTPELDSPWTEATQFVWWHSKLGTLSERPDLGTIQDIQNFVFKGLTSPSTITAAEYWSQGICALWYCVQLDADKGWLFNQGYTQDQMSTQNYATGQHCVDSKQNPVEPTSHRCKQLVRVGVYSMNRSNDDVRHWHGGWVARSKGFQDGPEENFGVGWARKDDNSHRWTPNAKYISIGAIHEKWKEPGCYKEWDDNDVTDVTNYDPGDGGGAIQKAFTDSATDWGVLGMFARYRQGWWHTGTTGNCSAAGSVRLNHRISAVSILGDFSENSFYDADGAGVYALFVHRYKNTDWETYKCELVVRVHAWMWSKILKKWIPGGVGKYICHFTKSTKSWVYTVGPAEGQI